MQRLKGNQMHRSTWAFTGLAAMVLVHLNREASRFCRSFYALWAVLNYLLLATTCGAYHLRKKGLRLSNPWYVYVVLAVLDVEANFLVTKAYQYTSVTSVTLLDCFTIPAVMALSVLLLRAHFTRGHYGGALLCIAGLAVLVMTDGSSTTGGPQPLLGDALVLMGAVLYACSNVAQERLLLGATPVSELLALVGSWGTLLGGLQAIVLERNAWLAADWNDPWVVVAPLVGFALALYTFALLLPLVLMWGGATVLNLSLLTSDVWAAGARVVFFGGFGGTAGWFTVSLACGTLGLVLYARAGQTHPHPEPPQHPHVPWNSDPRVASGDGVRNRGGGGGDVDGVEAGMPYQRIGSFGIEGEGQGCRLGDPEAVNGWRLERNGGSDDVENNSSKATAVRGDSVSRYGVGSAGRGYDVHASADERRRLVDLEAVGEEVEEVVFRAGAGCEGEGKRDEERLT
ncbi:hypothetical protein VOLCADRAFT_99968 [Volvox carteri f. nagariensis]|uniref:EamA domain-containing protein n=1 Tax=Volvox carteri f. nagariensis TaxID=3068 RepID=D8UJ39_VOLCA|nr:uncharacterized protein VOLCADRAFT_99968 [Volvox carteri f. nagariensis]EFJ40282.1 hypothetical protein VOLCADRAFT_99968 [Volvox carteri f. nagariensis]|eukprot:XP_002958679.1 hypothetical protein VOLCADRAFT_99968 [Volvox carteri f. nagariensis]